MEQDSRCVGSRHSPAEEVLPVAVTQRQDPTSLRPVEPEACKSARSMEMWLRLQRVVIKNGNAPHKKGQVYERCH